MVHLCVDARMAYSSGIGTCIKQLVPYFNISPFKLTLLVDQFGRNWCKGIDQIEFKAPIYSIQEQLLYPKIIPKCDLFYSPNYNVPILPIRAKAHIVTVHDACHVAMNQHLSFMKRRYAKIMIKKALKSTAVITCSQFSKNELNRYFQKQDVHVIPIGVNPVHFQKKYDLSLQKKYALPNDYLLYVGNFKPHKNIETLLKAFSKSNLQNWKLVLVGKNSNSPVDDERIIYLENITDEELPSIYSMAKMFVFPSLYEGFGLPPLEAMSTGCPTIVSSAASIPEVCGNASLYFSPTNVDQLTQLIERLAKDDILQKDLIQKGYKRIQNFDWEKCANKYLKIFKDCYDAKS